MSYDLLTRRSIYDVFQDYSHYGETVEKVAYILIGAFIAFILNIVKDSRAQKIQRKKEVEYLSVHVSFILERFIEGCVDVVYDDGLYHGERDQEGCRQVLVNTPSLDIQSLDVDWKALPTNMMYKILDLPNEIYLTNKRVSSAAEHSAYPPDYEEIFEERQYGYAKLGMLAISYVAELRELSKIPKRESSQYDPEHPLIEKINEIENVIKLREHNRREQQI